MSKQPFDKKWKKVTKEEFANFVAKWPNKLEVDLNKIFWPPLKTYNDFSNGKVWPDSVVCMVKFDVKFNPVYYLPVDKS